MDFLKRHFLPQNYRHSPNGSIFYNQEIVHNMRAKSLSCVQLFVILWAIAGQGLWSGLSLPPPGDLPDPGMEPVFLMSSALAGTISTTWEAQFIIQVYIIQWLGVQWLRMVGVSGSLAKPG